MPDTICLSCNKSIAPLEPYSRVDLMTFHESCVDCRQHTSITMLETGRHISTVECVDCGSPVCSVCYKKTYIECKDEIERGNAEEMANYFFERHLRCIRCKLHK